MSIERELRALREAVERLTGAVHPPMGALAPASAAAALGISLSTLRRMVRRGLLLTVDIGGRKMVPLSEIRRLTTPRQEPTPKSRRDSGYSAAAEAARARAKR